MILWDGILWIMKRFGGERQINCLMKNANYLHGTHGTTLYFQKELPVDGL